MMASLIREENRSTLLVNGKPYLILGGEVLNSSASSEACLQQQVWPAVRGLNLNTLALPIYWELLEPEEGRFDFTLVDGILAQARCEGLHLILLWFGLWKNAQSTYAPTWVKQDTARFQRAQFTPQPGYYHSACLISPCCEAAVQADARAFAALMAHLKRQDEAEGTVILVQVENEVGILGAAREQSPAARRLYEAELPALVARQFGAAGSWESAFGPRAPELFSAHCFAGAVETIAAAGKREYALPMYVNAWTVQYPGERPGGYPSGGPVAEQWAMWRLCAPSIDFFSPDIYLPDFAAECDKYAAEGNPLFVPEAHCNNNAASAALYLPARYAALGFSPFGIEIMRKEPQAMGQGAVVQEAFESSGENNAQAADYLAAAYGLLKQLWPQMAPLRGTARLQSCLQANARCEGLEFSAFGARVRFGAKAPGVPCGAALLLECAPNEFLVAGVNCSVDFMPPVNSEQTAELLVVEQGELDATGAFIPHCRLNGDEQRLRFGAMPSLLRATLHIPINSQR